MVVIITQQQNVVVFGTLLMIQKWIEYSLALKLQKSRRIYCFMKKFENLYFFFVFLVITYASSSKINSQALFIHLQ